MCLSLCVYVCVVNVIFLLVFGDVRHENVCSHKYKNKRKKNILCYNILLIWNCHLILDRDHSKFIFLMHIIWPIRYLISTCTNGHLYKLNWCQENVVWLYLSFFFLVCVTNNTNQMAIFVHKIITAAFYRWFAMCIYGVYCVYRTYTNFANHQCQIYCLINKKKFSCCCCC